MQELEYSRKMVGEDYTAKIYIYIWHLKDKAALWQTAIVLQLNIPARPTNQGTESLIFDHQYKTTHYYLVSFSLIYNVVLC